MTTPTLQLRLKSSTTAMVDVAGLGESSIDTTVRLSSFPRPDTKVAAWALTERPGGQVATAVRALARLGWRTCYVGAFGDDAGGALLRAALREDGVNLDGCHVASGVSTRRAVILVDEGDGSRTVLAFRDPRLNLPPGAADAAVGGARVLLVDGTDLAASLAAAHVARAADVRVVVDVDENVSGADPLLSLADVLICSEAFARVTGAADAVAGARVLAGRYPAAGVVCVTLGKAGCVALCSGQEIRVPAFRVPCIDSTGAGDVFRAGFIAAWLGAAGPPALQELLRYACAAAALNCRAAGAQGGLPTSAEVQTLLDSGTGGWQA